MLNTDPSVAWCMAREMKCPECGFVKSYDNIATASDRCPRCDEPWEPNY